MPLRLLVFLASAFPLVAQSDPDPISTLLDRARAEPIEIFADVAFRLLEAGKIPENRKTALLEEIYQRAPQAREPQPWSLAQPAIPRGAAETRHQIQRLRLDTLSLRARSIQLLLATNPRRAVDLFDELPAPLLPPATCNDPYVASIDPLYETLLPVVTRGRFTPEEREKNRPLEMVLRRLHELRSPSELSPAARLVRELVFSQNWPADDLVNAYCSALASLQSDDRTFSYSLGQGGNNAFTAGISLATELRTRGFNYVALLSAWRIYLARHLQSSRCADSYARLNRPTTPEMTVADKADRERWRDLVFAERIFNRTLAEWNVSDVPMLAAGDILPEKLAGSVPASTWPDEQDLDSLHRAIGTLFTNGQSTSWVSAAERQTPEWDQRAAPILRRVEDFRGTSKMPPNDVWLQRVQLWSSMMDAAPPGSVFQRAVQGWIAEMSDARARAEQPALWLIQFQIGFKMARPFSKEEAEELKQSRKHIPGLRVPKLPHPSGSVIIEAMRQAPDPALALYADLESLAPQSHGSWMR